MVFILSWGVCSILGGAATLGLFYLADFSSNPRDMFILSIYGNVAVGLVGGVFGVLFAAAITLLARRLHRPLHDVTLTRGLSTFLFGCVVLSIASSVWAVSRRPMSLFDPEILIPALVGFVIVLLATRWVILRAKSKPRELLSPRRGLTLGGLLIMTGIVVPPIAGIVLFGEETDLGDEPIAVEQEPEAAGRRLLIVGWDGATWEILDQMLAEGKMGNLQDLLERGIRSTLWAKAQEIQPFRNSASGGARSPALWETLATGKDPRQHGVWDFKCTLLPGVQQMIPFRLPGFPVGSTVNTKSQVSRATRVWEILESVGLATAVVGWYTTWPIPENSQGILVSDYAVYGQHDSVAPEGVVDFNGLLAQAADETKYRLSQIGQGVGIPADGWDETSSLNSYREEYARDLAKAMATEQILREHRPDFTAVYLRLTDLAQHKFWCYFEPEAYGLDTTEEEERYGWLIPYSYEVMDELLGSLLDAAGEETSVVILSDHGGGPWVLRGLKSVVGQTMRQAYHRDYSGNHRLDGMLVWAGPDHRTARDIGDINQTDLVPTVLSFFGLPVADDMPGRVLAVGVDGVDGPSVHNVPTYEYLRLRRATRRQDSEVDDEIQRQLKSLGYVQ
jgi:predicted AlkP superfamily phosphohydrolase/phosphomutase